ncbi:MAG: hypothetical protein QNJ45_09915 [Ardenticatenaceae bacterium]|nr:hypothetical protein [Ardenticatenaceae bacterium]
MPTTFGLLYCTLYILGCIAVGEGLSRIFKLGSDFSRKVVHIGVGMVVWFLPIWFTTPWPFVAMCGVFAVINFLDWKFGLLPGMNSSDKQNLGTVYFPIVTGLVSIIYWGYTPLMVAAMMPLTWGDGIAPIIGRRFGRQPYEILGNTRTMEGSFGFFVFATVASAAAMLFLPGPPPLETSMSLIMALLLGVLTAVTEGVSPWGLDNLTIPMVSVILLLPLALF